MDLTDLHIMSVSKGIVSEEQVKNLATILRLQNVEKYFANHGGIGGSITMAASAMLHEWRNANHFLPNAKNKVAQALVTISRPDLAHSALGYREMENPSTSVGHAGDKKNEDIGKVDDIHDASATGLGTSSETRDQLENKKETIFKGKGHCLNGNADLTEKKDNADTGRNQPILVETSTGSSDTQVEAPTDIDQTDLSEPKGQNGDGNANGKTNGDDNLLLTLIGLCTGTFGKLKNRTIKCLKGHPRLSEMIVKRAPGEMIILAINTIGIVTFGNLIIEELKVHGLSMKLFLTVEEIITHDALKIETLGQAFGQFGMSLAVNGAIDGIFTLYKISKGCTRENIKICESMGSIVVSSASTVAFTAGTAANGLNPLLLVGGAIAISVGSGMVGGLIGKRFAELLTRKDGA